MLLVGLKGGLKEDEEEEELTLDLFGRRTKESKELRSRRSDGRGREGGAE